MCSVCRPLFVPLFCCCCFVSFSHCIVYPLSMLSLFLLFHLGIVLVICLRCYHCLYFFIQPLYCLFFYDVIIVCTFPFSHCIVYSFTMLSLFVLFHLAIVLSVLLRFYNFLSHFSHCSVSLSISVFFGIFKYFLIN